MIKIEIELPDNVRAAYLNLLCQGEEGMVMSSHGISSEDIRKGKIKVEQIVKE
jgi:hypothetical protein